MRRNTLVLGVLSLVMAASTALAQGTPNFAGHWMLVPDPNAAAGGGGRGGRGGRGGLGPEITIAQDEKTMTITRTTQAGEVKTVYNLDGSESKNTQTMGGNSVEQVSNAKWEGSKLVVTTSSEFNGNTFTTTQAFSLDASGQLLVEVTSPGRGGGAPTTTTLTYKKG